MGGEEFAVLLPHTTKHLAIQVAEEPSLKPAIKRADRELYIAKAQGRNQAHWQTV